MGDAQQNLASGTKVKVHGIPYASMARFNGKLGKVQSHQPLAKGYKGAFDDGSSSQAIPRANLRVQTLSSLPAATAAKAGVPTQTFDTVSGCEVGVVAGGTNKFI